MDRSPVEEALDYCLANPDRLSAEELLGRFPEYREELQPLLALSANIVQVAQEGSAALPPDRRAAMKARLQAAAALGGSAATIAAPLPITATPATKRPATMKERPWWLGIVGRRSLAAATFAALFLALFWWAAVSALPDSPFYRVKLASENFMLGFAGDDAARASVHLDLAEARLAEIRAMGEQGKLGSAGPAIDDYATHINSCSSLLGRTGAARAALEARLGESIIECDTIIKGFGPDLGALPSSTKSQIEDLYGVIGQIGPTINVTPPQPPDIFNSISPITPVALSTRTPRVLTANAANTSTATPVRFEETPPALSTVVSAAEPTATQAAIPSITPLRAPTQVPTARQTPTRAVPTQTNTPVRVVIPPTAVRPTSTALPSPTSPRLPIPTPTFTPPPVTNGTATSAPVLPTLPVVLPTQTLTVPPVPSVIPSNTPVLPLPTIPTLPSPPLPTVPLPTVPLPTVPLPTVVLPTVPLPTAPLPTVPLPTAPLPTIPLPTVPLPTLPPQSATNTPSGDSCSISLREVTIGCAGNDVEWSLEAENDANETVAALWTAELQAQLLSGPWVTVDVAGGNIDLLPGTTTYQDEFSTGLPVGVRTIRVQVTIVDAGRPTCRDSRTSPNTDPC